MMKCYAVILGGGSGRRMNAGMNKVFLPLRGIPAIVRAIAPFSSLCAGAVVVACKEELERMKALLSQYGLNRFVVSVVPGGAERQESVLHGLEALPQDAQAVLIHDGARALVTEETIQRVLRSVEENGSGVAAVPVTDTIKRATSDGQVLETLEREALYAMQTPQGFLLSSLREAHDRAALENFTATDDAGLLEKAGMPVRLVMGDRENLKLTTPVDMELAEVILNARIGRETDA